jgi:hypothetical protein
VLTKFTPEAAKPLPFVDSKKNLAAPAGLSSCGVATVEGGPVPILAGGLAHSGAGRSSAANRRLNVSAARTCDRNRLISGVRMWTCLVSDQQPLPNGPLRRADPIGRATHASAVRPARRRRADPSCRNRVSGRRNDRTDEGRRLTPSALSGPAPPPGARRGG